MSDTRLLLPSMFLLAILLAGCLNVQSVQSENEGVAEIATASETWTMTVDDTAVLVHVVADEDWTIVGQGDLRDD